jgi:hypothetical protein
MIPNCKSCLDELSFACWCQEMDGLHLAIPLQEKGHLHIIMVDDDGKIIVE